MFNIQRLENNKFTHDQWKELTSSEKALYRFLFVGLTLYIKRSSHSYEVLLILDRKGSIEYKQGAINIRMILHQYQKSIRFCQYTLDVLLTILTNTNLLLNGFEVLEARNENVDHISSHLL